MVNCKDKRDFLEAKEGDPNTRFFKLTANAHHVGPYRSDTLEFLPLLNGSTHKSTLVSVLTYSMFVHTMTRCWLLRSWRIFREIFFGWHWGGVQVYHIVDWDTVCSSFEESGWCGMR